MYIYNKNVSFVQKLQQISLLIFWQISFKINLKIPDTLCQLWQLLRMLHLLQTKFKEMRVIS